MKRILWILILLMGVGCTPTSNKPEPVVVEPGLGTEIFEYIKTLDNETLASKSKSYETRVRIMPNHKVESGLLTNISYDADGELDYTSYNITTESFNEQENINEFGEFNAVHQSNIDLMSELAGIPKQQWEAELMESRNNPEQTEYGITYKVDILRNANNESMLVEGDLGDQFNEYYFSPHFEEFNGELLRISYLPDVPEDLFDAMAKTSDRVLYELPASYSMEVNDRFSTIYGSTITRNIKAQDTQSNDLTYSAILVSSMIGETNDEIDASINDVMSLYFSVVDLNESQEQIIKDHFKTVITRPWDHTAQDMYTLPEGLEDLDISFDYSGLLGIITIKYPLNK